jgi:hypothetical protein
VVEFCCLAHLYCLMFMGIIVIKGLLCRSQWARGLKCRSTAARILRSWVRIPPGAWIFACCLCCVLSGRSGPGSSVGIATGHGLNGPGIESRWGRDFSHTSRPAHPASCTMGTGYFPGVKRPGRGADHPPPPRAIPLLPLWALGGLL